MRTGRFIHSLSHIPGLSVRFGDEEDDGDLLRGDGMEIRLIDMDEMVDQIGIG
jgi:hypothetical protein